MMMINQHEYYLCTSNFGVRSNSWKPKNDDVSDNTHLPARILQYHQTWVQVESEVDVMTWWLVLWNVVFLFSCCRPRSYFYFLFLFYPLLRGGCGSSSGGRMFLIRDSIWLVRPKMTFGRDNFQTARTRNPTRPVYHLLGVVVVDVDVVVSFYIKQPQKSQT